LKILTFLLLDFQMGNYLFLQNKRLELNEDHYIIGDQRGGGWYNKEEQKRFIPGEHEFYRKKLEECLQYNGT
jgi:hypothetical protein